MNILPDIKSHYGDGDNNSYGISSKRNLERKYLKFSFGDIFENTVDEKNGDEIDSASFMKNSSEKRITKNDSVSHYEEKIGFINKMGGIGSDGLPVSFSPKNILDRSGVDLLGCSVTNPVLLTAKALNTCQNVNKSVGVVSPYLYRSSSVEINEVSVVFLRGNSGISSVWVRDFFGKFSRQDIRGFVLRLRSQMLEGAFSRLRVYINAKIMS